MPVAETHYYDVMTRYRVVDAGASGAMGRMSRNTAAAAGSARSLSHWLAFIPYQFARIARIGLKFAGPVLFLAGIYKGMKAVNIEMETTLSMTAIIGASLHEMYSLQERWTISTQQTAKHYAQIAIDAASLPGELKDFTLASQLTMGPIMQAHAGQKVSVALRASEKFIGDLSIVRTAFGIDPQTAARQAQFMLGGMGRRQQRLFQMLQPFGIGTPAEFNAKSAAERFRTLSEAMAKVASSPLIRKRVFDLLETQMGTFKDAVFGPRGFFGLIGQMPLKGFIKSLQTVNKLLIMIQNGTNALGRFTGFWQSPEYLSSQEYLTDKLKLFNPLDPRISKIGMTGMEVERLVTVMAERKLLMNRYGTYDMAAINKSLGGFPGTSQFVYAGIQAQMPAQMAVVRKLLADMGDPDGIIAGVPDQNINQVIYATIDVKTDDSPEAVALKLERGFAQVARRPTMTPTGSPFVPTTRNMGRP